MSTVSPYDLALEDLQRGIHRLTHGDHHHSITPQQMYDDVQQRAQTAVRYDTANGRRPYTR